MASKSKRARMAPQRNLTKTFMYWAIAVSIIKLIIIAKIPPANLQLGDGKFLKTAGIWLGADGENYLAAYNSLLHEGVFSSSSTLNYFPAGYPLVIFLLSIFGKSWVLTTLSVFQSLVFSFASYIFASQISKTKLKKLSYTVFIFIILNPTLSLASIVVGYESLAASGFLIASGLIVKDFVEKNDKKFARHLLINSVIFGFLTFMQPRLILSGVFIILIWLLVRKGIKTGVYLLIPTLAITLFLPLTLVYRNHNATGFNTISTNLGTTMNIGAGEKATGGYMKKDFGVSCEQTGTIVQQDNQMVKCVLNWYISNPNKTAKLFLNKSLYFWSPWINNGFLGDVNTGTMSRNPWLKINPIKNISSKSDGAKLVFGGFGRLVSWLWLLGGLSLLFYGYFILWRQNSLERFIGNVAMVAVSTNWLVSLISIGDHRFRIPIMGMSLFLQAIGLRTLFKGGKAPMVEGPALR